jgi:folylpolyglutamate synthase/dihydrofolate synthase
MESPGDPPVVVELMRWCAERIAGREARRRRVPVLFDEFRDFGNNHIPIITVAGTSGKGSTCALLEAVLVEGGHVPGVFTKPHLISFRERVSVAGRWVSNSELAAHTERVFARLRGFVQRYGPDFRPSLFEALLLVAASIFRERGVTAAVYEAGIGGANDATSFLPAKFSVITSVDLDHENELGHSIEAIARDKAGIAPPGSILVLGAGLSARARTVAVSASADRGVRCIQADANDVEVLTSGIQGQTVRLSHQNINYTLSLPFVGAEQAFICATVWALTRILHQCGYHASLDAIRGVERARIQGRFELVRGSQTWLLDVAHNPASIDALLTTACQFLAPGRIVVILGATEPHDYRNFVRLVCARGLPIGVCEGFTRAIAADRLTAEIPVGAEFVGAFGSPAAAIDRLGFTQHDEPMTVIVTGSLLLVGQWRHELIRRGVLAGDD